MVLGKPALNTVCDDLKFLNQSLSSLPQLKVETIKLLSKLKLETVWDLLLHLPVRYLNHTKAQSISDLPPQTHGVVEGFVTDVKPLARNRGIAIGIKQANGQVALVQRFHASPALFARARYAKVARVIGTKTESTLRLPPCFLHPTLILATSFEALPSLPRYLTPVYRTVKGLTQKAICEAIDPILLLLPSALQAFWPKSVWEDRLTLAEALRQIHHASAEGLEALNCFTHPAQSRLILEELLVEQLSLGQTQKQRKKQKGLVIEPLYSKHTDPTAPISTENGLFLNFLEALPFKLTKGQDECVTAIVRDLKQPHPMLRLLQGDVGTGKTAVAAIVALHALLQGQQVIFLAPTALLATQHFSTLSDWFTPLGITTRLVMGKQPKGKKDELGPLTDQPGVLLVGTQALLHLRHTFQKVSLVVVDEQHRLGVAQRLQLYKKLAGGSHVPHQLLMSATPIPRTLKMALCKTLDVSFLGTPPANRKPIITRLLSIDMLALLYKRLAHAVQNGGQIYWICPLIDQADADSSQSHTLENRPAALKLALPNLRIAALHGKLKEVDKQRCMQQFIEKEIDLLVCTTVVEVGLDVPNANIIIIEKAEQFGLTQLHQLRGRVGRGDQQGYCILLYYPPLQSLAKERLLALRIHHEGSVLAEQDLNLRGPGQIYSTAQSGKVPYRAAVWSRDAHLMRQIPTLLDRCRALSDVQIERLLSQWSMPLTDFVDV